MKKVLILIPAFNEEYNIVNTLQKIKAVIAGLEGYDILVIDDGSADYTAEAARRQGVKVISQIYNSGYGSSLQLGYKYAAAHDYDYIMQLDADGQHDAENINIMAEMIESEDAPDILIGSRFLKESKSFKVAFMRRAAISLFRLVIKCVSGKKITDPTSGLQCLSRDAFSYYAKYTNFDYRYPDINMIVQMCILGFEIQEFPAVMHLRVYGDEMHSGIIKPINYMIIMSISTINAILRNKRGKSKTRL